MSADKERERRARKFMDATGKSAYQIADERLEDWAYHLLPSELATMLADFADSETSDLQAELNQARGTINSQAVKQGHLSRKLVALQAKLTAAEHKRDQIFALLEVSSIKEALAAIKNWMDNVDGG